MLDEQKFERLKKLAIFAVAAFLILLGFAFGKIGKVPAKSETKQEVTVRKETDAKGLSTRYVEEFLIAYYTKKDLSENRNRYERFMTKTMYEREVVIEEKAVNQAYKGYVVDYVYQSSEIYINQKSQKVLADIHYTSTLLKKQYNYEDAAKDVQREVMLEITFVKSGSKYLVSSMKPVALTDANDDDHSNHVHSFLTDDENDHDQ
ncbi:hypothetical protein [Streptococcus ovis]|uniref:hypothetical protein n=1 Tax=Streptococcus ovis TaxID=82806 RepID=UPI000378970E|nr:hypothetical protein [Streptococcus ovis]